MKSTALARRARVWRRARDRIRARERGITAGVRRHRRRRGTERMTIAERCSRALGMKVLTLERRAHAGGNCYDYVDARSGIRCSKYGAHLFHTKHARVWEYVTRFSEWVPFDHRVLGRVTRTSASEEGKRARVLVPIPPTRATVNALFDDADVRSDEDMEAWYERERIHPEGRAGAAERRGGGAVARRTAVV